jgi:hypothetical protein
VIPTSSILLNIPGPLSINTFNTFDFSEIKIIPGEHLLSEGIPVPDPKMIKSDIFLYPERKIEKRLTKNIRNFPSPLPSLPAYRQAGTGEKEGVRGQKFLWVDIITFFK